MIKTLYEAELDDKLMKQIEADVDNKERWDYLFGGKSWQDVAKTGNNLVQIER